MYKTNFFNNGSEFNSYYPSGVVPSSELAAVGSYNGIYDFVKYVFGIGPTELQDHISINSNSNVDVSSYKYAYVNVPINWSEVASAGYIVPAGTYSVTSNGTYNVNAYQNVSVNVPIPSGYIVPSGTKSITTNGTGIDVTSYANVDVAVPASGITPTGTYNVTGNGTYNVYTYANVNVNVPASAVVSGTYNITNNGTYDITNYASAYVNVSGSGPVLNWIAATREPAFDYAGSHSLYDPSHLNCYWYNCFENDYQSDYSDYSELKSWAIKTTQSNVYFRLVYDSDGDGDCDTDDELIVPHDTDYWCGIFNQTLTPNHIYYITMSTNKLGTFGFVFCADSSSTPVDGYVAYLG